MFCDHFHCGVGRVEGVVVDRSRMEGWEGCWEKEEKRRKCVNISPNRFDKYLTSQDVWNVYVRKIFAFSWYYFDRHLCILLLVMGTQNVLRNFCNMEQMSHWKMYEIIKNIERDIEIDLIWDSESLTMWGREWVQGKNDKENVWFLKFLGGIFIHGFFDLMCISIIEYGTLLCCVSQFALLIFFFFFFPHLSSPLICLSRAKYGISSLTLCLANHNNQKKTNWKKERDDSFDVRESLREMNN